MNKTVIAIGCFLALALALVAVGCDSSDGGGGEGEGEPAGAQSCVPGKSEACVCTSGLPGAQVCAADGGSFGPCECAGDPEAPGEGEGEAPAPSHGEGEGEADPGGGEGGEGEGEPSDAGGGEGEGEAPDGGEGEGEGEPRCEVGRDVTLEWSGPLADDGGVGTLRVAAWGDGYVMSALTPCVEAGGGCRQAMWARFDAEGRTVAGPVDVREELPIMELRFANTGLRHGLAVSGERAAIALADGAVGGARVIVVDGAGAVVGHATPVGGGDMASLRVAVRGGADGFAVAASRSEHQPTLRLYSQNGEAVGEPVSVHQTTVAFQMLAAAQGGWFVGLPIRGIPNLVQASADLSAVESVALDEASPFALTETGDGIAVLLGEAVLRFDAELEPLGDPTVVGSVVPDEGADLAELGGVVYGYVSEADATVFRVGGDAGAVVLGADADGASLAGFVRGPESLGVAWRSCCDGDGDWRVHVRTLACAE